MNNFLSPEQKLTIYKAMLIKFNQGQSLGFCEAAGSVVKELDYPYGTYDNFFMKDDLPELMKYKPERTYNYFWFPSDPEGISKRIKILEEIIAELETTTIVHKEITSVKTKQNYYLGFDFIPAGTPGIKHKNEGWKWNFQNGCMIKSESFIRENLDWFDFKENTKEFEFVFVAFGNHGNGGFFDENKLAKSELNRLAKWCDDQCELTNSKVNYFVVLDHREELATYSAQCFKHMGLKFNSQQSANLFITELSKPQNINYKNYFIELIKQPNL